MIDYSKIISKTISDIKPSGIRKFFDLAAEMEDCISLGVGEPDFSTPWNIRSEGIYSIEKGRTHYTANSGLIELRQEICKYFFKRFKTEYNPDNECIVTVGGSEAIDLALRAIISPGDEVLIPEPSFVCYSPITTLSNGVPVSLKTTEENEFRLTYEELKRHITPKTKALILSYPNNPTGAIMTKSDLEDICRALKGTDIIVISDEIYAELTYGEDHFSISSLPNMKERTIVVSGFSKAFAMTGWRLGYALGPSEIIKQMLKIHQFAIMSAPTNAQYAAIEALKNSYQDVIYMRDEYNMRRTMLVRRLREIGFGCFEPKGAFYVFPSLKPFGMSSDEFCQRLLKEEKVAIIPGNAFGESGEGFARISYAYSIKKLSTALDRIENFVNKL